MKRTFKRMMASMLAFVLACSCISTPAIAFAAENAPDIGAAVAAGVAAAGASAQADDNAEKIDIGDDQIVVPVEATNGVRNQLIEVVTTHGPSAISKYLAQVAESSPTGEARLSYKSWDDVGKDESGSTNKVTDTVPSIVYSEGVSPSIKLYNAEIDPKVENPLVEGKDFEIVSTTNNMNVTLGEEKASVTIKGLGSYTGTRTMEFKITGYAIHQIIGYFNYGYQQGESTSYQSWGMATGFTQGMSGYWPYIGSPVWSSGSTEFGTGFILSDGSVCSTVNSHNLGDKYLLKPGKSIPLKTPISGVDETNHNYKVEWPTGLFYYESKNEPGGAEDKSWSISSYHIYAKKSTFRTSTTNNGECRIALAYKLTHAGTMAMWPLSTETINQYVLNPTHDICHDDNLYCIEDVLLDDFGIQPSEIREMFTVNVDPSTINNLNNITGVSNKLCTYTVSINKQSSLYKKLNNEIPICKDANGNDVWAQDYLDMGAAGLVSDSVTHEISGSTKIHGSYACGKSNAKCNNINIVPYDISEDCSGYEGLKDAVDATSAASPLTNVPYKAAKAAQSIINNPIENIPENGTELIQQIKHGLSDSDEKKSSVNNGDSFAYDGADHSNEAKSTLHAYDVYGHDIISYYNEGADYNLGLQIQTDEGWRDVNVAKVPGKYRYAIKGTCSDLKFSFNTASTSSTAASFGDISSVSCSNYGRLIGENYVEFDVELPSDKLDDFINEAKIIQQTASEETTEEIEGVAFKDVVFRVSEAEVTDSRPLSYNVKNNGKYRVSEALARLGKSIESIEKAKESGVDQVELNNYATNLGMSMVESEIMEASTDFTRLYQMVNSIVPQTGKPNTTSTTESYPVNRFNKILVSDDGLNYKEGDESKPLKGGNFYVSSVEKKKGQDALDLANAINNEQVASQKGVDDAIARFTSIVNDDLWNNKLTYKWDLSTATVTYDSPSFDYDGKTKYAYDNLVVMVNGSTLTTSQYKRSGTSSAQNAGDYSFTVTANSSYSTGTVPGEFKWAIKPYSLQNDNVAADFEDVALAENPKVPYTGAAQQPTFNVLRDTTVLAAGTDYDVKYENNVNAGTAKAVIEGKGNYAESIEMAFTIDPASMENAVASYTSNQYVYTQKAITPTVNLKLGDSAVPSSNYKVQCYAATDTNMATPISSINPGTYICKVVPTNSNMTGEAAVPGQFTIARHDLSKTTVASTASMVYTGSTLNPTVTVKDSSGNTLKAGTHYTVKYQNASGAAATPVNAGSYKIVITGDGVYYGGNTVAKNFTITPAQVTSASLSGAEFTYNGAAQMPGVTVVGGGKTLLSNATSGNGNVNVTYSGASVNAGTYTVTVAGKGNYTGSKSLSYVINKAANPLAAKAVAKTVKLAKVKKKAQTVTGAVKITKKGFGTVTYTKASGKKNLTINKKTGKITVKKGTKKGTYSIKVKVAAAGDANYVAAAKTITVKVKVK